MDGIGDILVLGAEELKDDSWVSYLSKCSIMAPCLSYRRTGKDREFQGRNQEFCLGH